jgi:hypothetical protein
VVAQPANRRTVERPARRTGQRGAGRVRLGQRGGTRKPARQTPANGQVRAGLGYYCHLAEGLERHEHARGPGWFFNRNQKITPRGRPE